MNNPQRRVSIVIFDDVEVLDFCGPFEVFSVTGERQGLKPFAVHTVAEEARPIITRGGLRVNPEHTFDDCPSADILVVPGGFGTRREMNNPRMLTWLKDNAAKAELVLSVCSGALVLGKAGLLDGLTATTHHGALDELRAISPKITIDSSRRFIDTGGIHLRDEYLFVCSQLQLIILQFCSTPTLMFSKHMLKPGAPRFPLKSLAQTSADMRTLQRLI